MQLKAKKDFSWAHAGVRIEHYAKGALIETDDQDLIRVAREEGWAEQAKLTAKDTAKAAAIADLEARIAAAAEADKPALQAELDALKSE